MKIALFIVAGLAISILLIWIMGNRLPVKHEASVSKIYPSHKDKIWSLLSNFSDYPNWRSSIKSVEKLPNDSREVWQETDRHNEKIAYATVYSEPGHRLDRRIVSKLPYGGQWSLQLTQLEHGCQLTITEHGEIYNVFFRVMAKYVFGYESSMKQFHADLSSALAESEYAIPN